MAHTSSARKATTKNAANPAPFPEHITEKLEEERAKRAAAKPSKARKAKLGDLTPQNDIRQANLADLALGIREGLLWKDLRKASPLEVLALTLTGSADGTSLVERMIRQTELEARVLHDAWSNGDAGVAHENIDLALYTLATRLDGIVELYRRVIDAHRRRIARLEAALRYNMIDPEDLATSLAVPVQ